MIINKKTKAIISCSNKPNKNWMGTEWYLVEDYSVLSQKIEMLYPRFEFVLNDNGELIDVVEIPKTQEEKNADRVYEIKMKLNDLDETINRATEDLYELTNIIPYETVQKVIEEKKELREELQKITGGDSSGI